jgi:hypothetical protein
LRDLLRYNLKTVRAYLLKEAFQQLWDYNSPAWAGKFLDDWCQQVMRSRIEPMKNIARSLRQHRWQVARAGIDPRILLTNHKSNPKVSSKCVMLAYTNPSGNSDSRIPCIPGKQLWMERRRAYMQITTRGLTRRSALRAFGGFAAALGPLARVGSAHDLRPGDPAYRFADYEAIVNRGDLKVRQVYQWPNINNSIIFSNIRNGLNGFQFSYDIPTELTQVVVQSYASANPAMYDDFIWDKYKFGESTSIKDTLTGEPARRNIWLATSVPYQDLASGRLPQDRNHPFYADTSIEGLQRRRVLFLT